MAAGPWPNVPVLLDRKVQMPELLIAEASFVTSFLITFSNVEVSGLSPGELESLN